MNRVNAEFQKAAARGLSLLFATGDNGVGADSGSCTRFCGQWPASSHYVTGVGGSTGSSKGAETAWSGSAGGFSDRWGIPAWQADVVAAFKKSATAAGKLPPAARFNNTGRGFPDVSAQSTDFLVINDGIKTPVAGTSCACPTFSGIVGLLNDLRAQAGKPSLGLLNPFFYQTQSADITAFQDVTKGNNPGCGTNGYTATSGWDAITGLGTPNYQRLAAAVKALP
jgi:tripeptidyl-peptidase-1